MTPPARIVVAKRLPRSQLERRKVVLSFGADAARNGQMKQVATFIFVQRQRSQAALDAALAIAEKGPGGGADVGPKDRPCQVTC